MPFGSANGGTDYEIGETVAIDVARRCDREAAIIACRLATDLEAVAASKTRKIYNRGILRHAYLHPPRIPPHLSRRVNTFYPIRPNRCAAHISFRLWCCLVLHAIKLWHAATANVYGMGAAIKPPSLTTYP